MPRKHKRGVNSPSAIHFPERTISLNEDPSSPKNAAVGNKSVSVGVQSVSIGVQNSAGVAMPTNASVAVLDNAHPQNQVIMARPKKKLPKFDGDGMNDLIRHCKTCKKNWMKNGITNTNKWT